MFRMNHSCSVAAISLLLLATTLAEASGGTGSVAPEDSRTIPWWPIYLALAFIAVSACYQLWRYLIQREPAAKVFPKLEFRRRLFAPYSGGNHASIDIGSKQDHA
mgnify:CR=1 FL=1